MMSLRIPVIFIEAKSTVVTRGSNLVQVGVGLYATYNFNSPAIEDTDVDAHSILYTENLIQLKPIFFGAE